MQNYQTICILKWNFILSISPIFSYKIHETVITSLDHFSNILHFCTTLKRFYFRRLKSLLNSNEDKERNSFNREFSFFFIIKISKLTKVWIFSITLVFILILPLYPRIRDSILNYVHYSQPSMRLDRSLSYWRGTCGLWGMPWSLGKKPGIKRWSANGIASSN